MSETEISPRTGNGPAFAFSHCEGLIREGDPDRYFATLFAPVALRPHLFALYAFSLTVARVREAAANPMAGEIRLQWWRDAIGTGVGGEVVDGCGRFGAHNASPTENVAPTENAMLRVCPSDGRTGQPALSAGCPSRRAVSAGCPSRC